MSCRGMLVGLVVVASVVVPPAARAERVAVVVLAAPDAPVSSGRLLAAVGRALADRGDGVLPDADQLARARLAAGATLARRLDGFGRAEALLEEGWRSYLAVRASYAAARLAEARTTALAVLDLDGGGALVGEISLKLGAVELALGRDGEAARDFRLAALLLPGRVVTDAEFKPAVVVAFEAARAQAVARAHIGLSSRPGGAILEVDGTVVGAGPRDEVLEAGLHIVVARAPGYATRAEVVAVGDMPAAELVLERDPAADVLAGHELVPVGTGEAAAARAVETLIAYAELDAIWLVAPVWRRAAPAVLAQYCTGVPVACTPVAEIGVARARDIEAAARTVVDGLREPRRMPVTLPSDARLTDGESRPGGGKRPGGEPPIWRNPWLWLGASGVALGALAVAIVVGGDDGLAPVVAGDGGDWRR